MFSYINMVDMAAVGNLAQKCDFHLYLCGDTSYLINSQSKRFELKLKFVVFTSVTGKAPNHVMQFK